MRARHRSCPGSLSGPSHLALSVLGRSPGVKYPAISGRLARDVFRRRGVSLSGALPSGWALRGDPRQHPVQPPRQPPGVAAQQRHDGRHQQQAHHGRVDQHAERQSQAQHLDHDVVGQDEGGEDADHDEGGAGDDPGGDLQRVRDRAPAVPGADPRLVHPGEQEDLVVHAQAEDDGEHHHRHVALDRHRAGDPQRRPAPAPLEDRHQDPVGGGDGQQVEDRGLERHQQAAEDHQDDEERQRHHHADDQRQPGGDDVEEVHLGGGRAGHVAPGGGARDGPRQHGVLEAVVQLGGAGGLRHLLGQDGGDQHRAVAGGFRRGGARGAGDVLQGVGDLALQGGPVGLGDPGLVDDDGERAVGARAEAPRDQVEGPPVGEAGGVRAVVDVAQPDGEQGDGQHHDDGQAGQQEPPRMVLHPLGVPVPAAPRLPVGAGDRFGDRGAHPQPVDAPAGQPQQGRDQGERAGHRGQHGDGGGHSELADEVDLGDVQSGERHHDGAPGDQDGPAAGGHRPAGRAYRVGAVHDHLAVPGDQEQRVVDADAQPDHGGQRGGDAGEVGGVGQQAEAGDADDDRQQGGQQREGGGQHAAEGGEQHDHRDAEADRLAGQVGGLGAGEFAERAAVVDGDAGRAQRLDGAVHPGQVGGAQRGGVGVEPDGDVADPAVRGERAGGLVGAGRRQGITAVRTRGRPDSEVTAWSTWPRTAVSGAWCRAGRPCRSARRPSVARRSTLSPLYDWVPGSESRRSSCRRTSSGRRADRRGRPARARSPGTCGRRTTGRAVPGGRDAPAPGPCADSKRACGLRGALAARTSGTRARNGTSYRIATPDPRLGGTPGRGAGSRGRLADHGGLATPGTRIRGVAEPPR